METQGLYTRGKSYLYMRSRLRDGLIVNKLCEDYKRGLGIIVLAKKYHASTNTVHNVLCKRNVAIKPTGRQQKIKITQEKLNSLYWENKLSATEIGKKYNCTEAGIRHIMYKYNIPRRSASEKLKLKYSKTPMKGRINPKINMNENLAYILGVVYGDGYIIKSNYNYNVCLAVTKLKFAEEFYRALEKVGLHPCLYTKQVAYRYPNRNNQFCVQASSKKFYLWFKKITLYNLRKVLIKRPSWIKGFLKGFYESEGTRNKYGRITIYNSNIKLIKLVNILLRNLRFRTSTLKICRKIPKGIEYTITIIGGRKEYSRFIKEIRPVIKGE